MDDLISEFLTETNESLAVLDLELVSLEKNPNDPDILGKIFRVMHTIKGTCGFLGLPRLASVAHAAENIMGKIRDGKMQATPIIISLILRAIDRIKELLEQLEKTGGEPAGEDKALIAELDECYEGRGPTAVGAAPAAAAAPPPPPPLPTTEVMPIEDVTGADTVSLDELERIFQSTVVSPEFDPNRGGDAPVPAAAEASAPVAHQEAAVAEGLKAAEKAKPAGGGNTTGVSVADQSIRVNIDVLENLMQMVSELVLTRNQLLQISRQRNDPEFITPLQRLSHITTDLQEGVMKTRMQPIGNAWNKFPRLIRDLSVELNKKIDLQMIGADTELDRQMLEMIKDPLTHMVRNSVDHGLEGPDDRRAAGKNETGTVTLNAYHEGGHIIIKIADDGRGINVDRVKRKAIENGLATQAEIDALSDQQIYQFIFKAGFSTAEKVTAVSGRGVGMDVVITNIQKIGGTIELFSEPGKGSTFLIKIPLTLAIMPVLVVECASQRFAIPQIRVNEIVSVDMLKKVASEESGEKTDLVIEEINDSMVLRLRNRLLPLFKLNEILRMSAPEKTPDELFVVVCQVGSYDFGLVVDKVFDTEEIVVKPVAPVLKTLEVYSGCTILGDGSVILILDPNGIINTAGVSNTAGKDSDEQQARQLTGEQNVTFLVFRAGGKAPKCVPLELVSRLEEVDVAHIEWSGNARVVQYRGDLMRIITLDDTYAIPEKGRIPVVVFIDEGRILGVVVQEILDIVEQPMKVKDFGDKSGNLGNLVIHEQTTDLIDVSFYFSQVFANYLQSPAKVAAEAEKNADKPHVLLVDDSPFFRKFMQPILAAAQYRVTTAESAMQAIEYLEKGNDFSAVITDIDMPEMDGIEFLRKFRTLQQYGSVPMVALSSFSNDEILAKTDDIKFDGYVSKSNRDSLVETLCRVLKK